MHSRPSPWRTQYQRRFAAPQTVVVQPTTWCNLDCRYCYLPFRKLKHQMSPKVAAALARAVGQLDDSGQPIGIVWHGGEPFAVGQQNFRALLAPFEELRHAARIHHYVQTNTTLITDTWCELLAEHDVRVGVSIDGPAKLNAERVDLRGKSAFDRILRGITTLREHGVPFSVISVVGTLGIAMPEELLEFLGSLGARSVGFNIEEIEGVNTDREPPSAEQAEDFWRRVLTWSGQHPDAPEVREVARLADYLRLIRSGHRADWSRRLLDPIPTVSWKGDVVLLSPELADTTAPEYDDFAAGNILERPLTEILRDAHRLRYVRDFLTGLDRCEAECEFFDFCRGAQAANRYFENDSLKSTETNYCRVSRQALVTALSTLATKESAA
ncbi:cyclophane-forming radical SAM peptide maturase AmcB [Streptomyces millisiae]|uniref:Cyclophane-forming radical SAM peptide maturase AmcB n=1 Tax=Streptomyces millisiae TaxID=3075542 RepID=A0ABU2M015_9ACTN|nr:cyclophane-forming radical SAM peptide maturase AmcB [Streptomyces sp. DSM 44918]MDT0323161.1 cyclophane-forming radical SAM peptide maturase AmcB [Streptomyces sp. DSM 44918]